MFHYTSSSSKKLIQEQREQFVTFSNHESAFKEKTKIISKMSTKMAHETKGQFLRFGLDANDFGYLIKKYSYIGKDCSD